MTISDVIVGPDDASLADIQSWTSLLAQYKGRPVPLYQNQASDVAVPQRTEPQVMRADCDNIQAAFARWAGPCSARAGETVQIDYYTSLQASPVAQGTIGVSENGGPIVTLGIGNAAPLDGTWTRFTVSHTLLSSFPVLTIVAGQQDYSFSPANDGVYVSAYALPAGRVYAPQPVVPARRLIIIGDLIAMGENSADYQINSLMAYCRRTYPGSVTLLTSDTFAYILLQNDYGGTPAAAGTAIGAAFPNATDEIVFQLGVEDLTFWPGSGGYATLADLQTAMQAVFTNAVAATAGRVYVQTCGDLNPPLPPGSLGTVAQMRAAQIAAATAAGIPAGRRLPGANMYSLPLTGFGGSPSDAQQAGYGPALRAAMGSW